MNTVRACAVMGLGFSLAFASGCSSSDSGKKDAGRDGGGRDSPFNTNTSTNTTTATTCTYTTASGTTATLNQGQYFTNNCVRYTCVSGTNFTSSGSPCTDAGPTTPDTRLGNDVPAPRDTADAARPADQAPPADQGNRDVVQGEAGQRDSVTPVLDGYIPDLIELMDTKPPTPDLPPPADLAVVCSNAGTDYTPGQQYRLDVCNYCVCLATGDFACTSKVCVVDGGGID